MKLKLFGSVLLFLLIAGGYSTVCTAAPSRKPLPPLQVSITPVQPGITPDQIKPGDIVDFKVTAVSRIDVQEMRVDVDLAGGAKLVSGDTSWTGPAGKNEKKSVLLKVQAPAQGKGWIRAHASLPPSDGARFSVEAQFVLGPGRRTKPEKEHPVKKDSRGKNIIEYR